MFKNLIIVVLGILLIAGAASSRPGEESFKSFYEQRSKLLASADRKGLLDRIFHGGDSRETGLDKCVYHDRLLWADVEQDGKVQFTGVFGRWVCYEDVSAAMNAKHVKG